MKAKSLAALVLCITIIFIFAGCTAKDTTTAPKKTTTATVTKGTLQIGLSADGRIYLSLTNLNFEVAGIVKKINVAAGQEVKAGDILAELDDTDLKLALVQAENALSQAEANDKDVVNQRKLDIMDGKIKLSDAKAKHLDVVNQNKISIMDEKIKLEESKTNYYHTTTPGDAVLRAAYLLEQAKYSTLIKNAASGNASAKAAYDLEKKRYDTLVNSDSSIQNSKLSMEEATNNMTVAKNNLAKIILKAPVAGKIINIAYKVGELVTGSKTTSGTIGGATSSTTSFMTMSDPKVVYMKASVTEGDIAGIEKGQAMSVTVDSLDLSSIAGEVVTVSNIAKIDNSGIVTYEVSGKLKEPNKNILDGMSCFITYLKKEKANVLLLTNKAVFIENSKQFVNVQLANGTVEKRAVSCGLTNGVDTEVIEGVKEGDTVVIGGVKK